MFLVHKAPSTGAPQLKSANDQPDLSATSGFWSIIGTLPETEPVPPAIIYFGFLTCQLESYQDDFSVNRDAIPVTEVPEAIVPPKTLQGIRYIINKLSNAPDHIDKEAIGTLCETAGLDRPPEEGSSLEAASEATRRQNPVELSCFSMSPTSKSSRRTTASEEETNHQCPHCSEVYQDEIELESHKRECNENPEAGESCPHCIKTFDNKVRLRWHKNRCSEAPDNSESEIQLGQKDDGYDCPYCSNSYGSEGRLRAHKQRCVEAPKEEENKRSESAEYRCQYCSDTFKNKSGMESHDCDKKIDIISNSTEKENSTENRCPYCSTLCGNEAILKEHKQRCTEGPEENQKGVKNKLTSKKHKCSYCNKRFDTERKLNIHKKNCSKSRSRPDVGSGESVGKSVKKDNRGERVAGKNPFADPERLKDAGLHKGGG